MKNVPLKGDQATTRALNKRMILDILRREVAVSRSDLAAQTGLSGASVTALVQDLMDQGLLKEGEASKSSGGRRPVPVSINYDARWSIGIKLQEGRMDGILTNLASVPLRDLSTDLPSTTPDTVANAAGNLVRQLIGDPKDRTDKLIGLGVALPGFIDVDCGVVLSSHRLGWRDVPLSSMIAAEVGTPVWIENDVNAYAIAQGLFGLARDCRSVLTVILGTGIGAALITNGKIHRGRGYRAGEIGFYRPIGEGGGLDLSALYSLDSLQRRWDLIANEDVSLHHALASHSAAAEAFLRAEGEKVGQRLALLVQLIDPDVVVIGGETLSLGEHYCAAIERAIFSGTLEPHTKIAFDRDNDIWARGAAVLAIDHFFDFQSVGGHRSML